ncbi:MULTISPECIES: NADH-quinone oxidoreductase subunit J [Nocardiopsis]|uniref:NADH-quinone oxidoreductase subunit J n=1 Tax=Nocardiopsis sinuspersici TaxID=501010 RepID=A0A1V3BXZ9_9ACTN|nr:MULTISPECIES: NADH-quinone oxidoreductase subunit J [Nocardiopsis]NYH54524.1 NADH:ubiquinone oxidoreductase subunit 6 (subunit J) [Nocardiopsis sinuspersici]OOC53293.1 NADH:ubiquinone oxidoreductase subunit J [Nocardiopsis sinuspersici]
MAETVVFAVCAVGAVASGAAVFVVDSMARATFALLASFLLTAVAVLLLGLSYLGVLVILMMVMEMMVMAVFMIMYMMNPAGLMPMTMVHNKVGSLVVSAGVFLLLAAGAVLVPWPERTGEPPADPTRALGEAVMGEHMLVMMLVGLVLFATMVAATVLTTHRGRYDRYGDDLRRERPDDPIGGGLGR